MHRLAMKYYEPPLSQIRPANPPPDDSIYLRGMAAYGDRKWDEAISSYEKINPDHRFHERALYYTGHAYAGRRNYQAAMSIFDNELFDDGQYIHQASWNKILMKMLLKYPETEVLADLDALKDNENEAIKSKVIEMMERLNK